MVGRLLLIGVAPAVRAITCRRLEEAGYVVDRAVDAAEAIRQARRLRFDAIIVDVTTPDVGVQVCREVRQAGLEASLLLLTDRREAATISAANVRRILRPRAP